MKVFHVVYSDPIGPSWIAYVQPPILKHPRDLLIRSWVEEVELSKLTQDFIKHIIYSREMGEDIHCLLEIRDGGLPKAG